MFRLRQISAREVDAARPVAQLYGAFAKVQKIVQDFRANNEFRTPNLERVGDEVRGERTPLACDFRRPAGNLVQPIFA
jgi:hypothetical protein